MPKSLDPGNILRRQDAQSRESHALCRWNWQRHLHLLKLRVFREDLFRDSVAVPVTDREVAAKLHAESITIGQCSLRSLVDKLEGVTYPLQRPGLRSKNFRIPANRELEEVREPVFFEIIRVRAQSTVRDLVEILLPPGLLVGQPLPASAMSNGFSSASLVAM